MLTTTQSKLKMTLSALFITTLTACGGGGSNGIASTTQPTTTTPTPTPAEPTPAQQMDAQFGLYLTDLANNHILPSYQQLANNEIKLKH